MRRVVVCAAITVAVLWSMNGWAQWIPDGIPICVMDHNQLKPHHIPDGSGGAIIVWADNRTGYIMYVFAQRVNAEGVVQWAANGVCIRAETGSFSEPQIVPDGSGGAIIAWEQRRDDNSDIYAQRIDANGVKLWVAEGVPVCTAAGDQRRPAAGADGSGGAIITWQDERNGNRDVYAQRIDANGSLMWAEEGAAVCTATGNQSLASVVPDGVSGGGVLVWYDERDGRVDYYAQRANGAGAMLWADNGVKVCTANAYNFELRTCSDGMGGAMVTWANYSGANARVFVQRVRSDGTCPWAPDGIPVSGGTRYQQYAAIVSDGSRGAIVAWGEIGAGMCAQRFNENGAKQWSADPAIICTTGSYMLDITSDGAGGAVAAGIRTQPGQGELSWDILAQRVDANGLPGGPLDGIPVCSAVYCQNDPRIVSDGRGGGIVVWEDSRNAPNGGEPFDRNDIYAGHVAGALPPMQVHFDVRPGSCPNPLNPKSMGVLPTAILGTGELDVRDIDPATIEVEGVAPLRWSYEDVAAPVDDNAECACTEAGPDGIGDLTLKFDVPELVASLGPLTVGQIVVLKATGALQDGTRFEGRDCVVIRGDGQPKDRGPSSRLGVTPQSRPTDRIQRIGYDLPEASTVEVSVYDVSGRLIKKLEQAVESAGAHTREWDTSGLSSGVYFCRVATKSLAETVKIVLLK